MTLFLPLVVVSAALVAAEPAPASAVDAASTRAPDKLLVLDFRDDGVGESAVRVLRDSLAAHLSKDARLEVMSTEDMRRVIDVESQKRALGCSDESCLAEIAGALGARLLVYGTVGKLGETVVVNVSLYDADAQRSVGRETIEADKIDAMLPRLRDASDRLIGRLFGTSQANAASSGGGSELLLWSGVGVGVVGAVIGGAALVVALGAGGAVADAPTFAAKQLDAGVRDGAFVLAGAAAAVAVAGAGVAAFALLE